MKFTYSIILGVAILLVSCQKEVTKGVPSPTNITGVKTTSTIAGLSVTKDGFPYPNISASSSFGEDEIGWHIDLQMVESGYTHTTQGQANLGDASLYCGGIHTVNLLAGQNIPMGTLTYANDAQNLYVTYTTNPDWYMSEVHLYVGLLSKIPKAGGNPPPGQFPISSTFSSSHLAQTVTYTIPITADLLSGTFAIAAHSSVLQVDSDGDVVGKETAWAQGPKVPGAKNWSMYVPATLDFCGGGPADITKANNNK